MAIKVKIPMPLQKITQGKAEVETMAKTVLELVDNLESSYPGIKERIMEDSKIRRFINIYINGEDIRFLQGEQTPVNEGDEVSIVPAIAGG